MTRLLTAAVSVLALGAVAPAWAQSTASTPSFGICNQTTGDIAECLNRAIADRNDSANAVNAANYGSSGVPRYEPMPAAPPTTTTTTTTTTYSRTLYPPPYPGASR